MNKWSKAGWAVDQREVPEEVAVAIVYNGTTHAVMMATPSDIEDFALGFALTEGLIEHRGQCQRFEIVQHRSGIEARLWLSKAQADLLGDRRRRMAGPTGCGLCGIESLEQAERPLPRVPQGPLISPSAISPVMERLRALQALNDRTRAVHAAALWDLASDRFLIREDVGRHNALDKLIGAATRQDFSTAQTVLLLTSRVSIEMVQKAAIAGIPTLVAISCPTAAAIRAAHEAGITVVGIARTDGFEVFTHGWRVLETAHRTNQFLEAVHE